MKKKLNIVLLVIVFSLWGTVIYKYVNQYFGKTESLSFTGTNNHAIKKEILKKDTFDLKSLERDPFLNKTSATVRKPVANVKRVYGKKENKKEIPKVSNFPGIHYYGYIKDIDKKHETILLSVNGSFCKLQLNQDKDGLKVTALSKDSIKVKYNKEFKWVRLKKN